MVGLQELARRLRAAKDASEFTELMLAGDVDFIDLRFVDLPGRWHHVTIPTTRLRPSLFVKGTGFDGSVRGHPLDRIRTGDLEAAYILLKRSDSGATGCSGIVGAFMFGAIDFFVSILELISELAKILSFSFRLFGNIFAGEVMLIVLSALVPLILTIPFLGLEVFVGLIQAFIFFILTVAFFTIATISHDHAEANH